MISASTTGICQSSECDVCSDKPHKAEKYTHCEHALHISKFDSCLKELAQMYYEDCYSNTYDENEKVWEEIQKANES